MVPPEHVTAEDTQPEMYCVNCSTEAFSFTSSGYGESYKVLGLVQCLNLDVHTWKGLPDTAAYRRNCKNSVTGQSTLHSDRHNFSRSDLLPSHSLSSNTAQQVLISTMSSPEASPPTSPTDTTTPPPLHEFLVIVPDTPDVELSQRLSVRNTHLINMLERFKAGQVSWGGAVLEDQPTPPVAAAANDGHNGLASGPKPAGSAMLYKAENMEQVRSWVENDVYATSGVWDVSKVQYLPFRTAALPVQK